MELRRPRVLALVLAGGAGGRLEVLTEERAKPAMPFAGVYRLVDFTLSNCRHSGVEDVWVVQQYEPSVLSEHLANGRPWDLDRTHGGLRVLHPHLGREESGWYGGNADAIYRHKADIRAFDPDVLLVLSADHVYKLDYADVLERHARERPSVTVVTTRVSQAEASRFGVVETRGGTVTSYSYKPDEPASDVVATEVFAFDARRLLAALDDLGEGEEEQGLGDLGDELLPRLVRDDGALEHRLPGYWRDVGTVESYWGCQLELVGDEPPLDLDDPRWPILTWAVQRPPAWVAREGEVDGALLSPGCRVHGRVERSVLAPGVIVEAGALVRDAVVLQDTRIGPGASVERAIVDEGVAVGEGARVGGAGDLALVGQGARVGERAVVAPGTRVAPRAERS